VTTFVALSAAFQARGLSDDGLLSDGASVRATPLWNGGAPQLVRRRALNHDYTRYFGPHAAFIQEELRQGRLPLWNPYIGTGVPIAEALMTTVVHPFTLFLVVLPYEYALTVLAVLRVAIAGMAAFALGRVLGAGVPAALLAGVVFMWSPFQLGFRFHPLTNVSGLLPLVLAVSELRLAGASFRRCLASWSLLGTFMILGGHAETFVHAMAGAWAYHLLRAIWGGVATARGRRVAAALGFLAAGTALAVLGASVVVYGHVEAVLGSVTMRARGAFTGYPHLPVAHLGTYLVPETAVGFIWPLYIGTLTLVLAAAGVAARARSDALPWVAIGIVAVLGAFRAWPIGPIIEALPLVRVADNTRLTMLAELAAAVLAARALDGIDQRPVRRAMIAGVFVLGTWLASLWMAGRIPYATGIRPAVLLAVAASVAIAGPRLPGVRWLVIGVVAVDLYLARAPAPQPGRHAFPPPPPVLQELAGPGSASRAFIPERVLPNDIAMLYRVPSISGYEPVMSRRSVELMQRAGLHPGLYGVEAPPAPIPHAQRLLSLLGVGHVVLADPSATDPGLEEVTRTPLPVYRNPDVFPRAFVADAARVAHDDGEALALLDDPRLDLRHVVVLEAPAPPDGSHTAAPEPVASAAIRAYRPGAATIVVESGGGGYLVFTETYSPGWRATLDGASTAVLRADYALIGVSVPAGRHEVRLRYLPTSLVIGAVVSLVVTTVLVAMVVQRPGAG